MPTVHVVDRTTVSPEKVLEAARDFSERRAEMWPDVHVEYLEVHEEGDKLADVTEGNPWPIGHVWERLRYDWSEPGSLKGTVTDEESGEGFSHPSSRSAWRRRRSRTTSVTSSRCWRRSRPIPDGESYVPIDCW
jgi:hypothetical protein